MIDFFCCYMFVSMVVYRSLECSIVLRFCLLASQTIKDDDTRTFETENSRRYLCTVCKLSMILLQLLVESTFASKQLLFFVSRAKNDKARIEHIMAMHHWLLLCVENNKPLRGYCTAYKLSLGNFCTSLRFNDINS